MKAKDKSLLARVAGNIAAGMASSRWFTEPEIAERSLRIAERIIRGAEKRCTEPND